LCNVISPSTKGKEHCFGINEIIVGGSDVSVCANEYDLTQRKRKIKNALINSISTNLFLKITFITFGTKIK